MMRDQGSDALSRTWTSLLAARDDAARVLWGELFEHYRTRLAVRIRFRLPATLRSRVAEDDIVQQVYARAFELRSRLTDASGRGPLRWLTAICDRVLAEIVKRESLRIVDGIATGSDESDRS